MKGSEKRKEGNVSKGPLESSLKERKGGPEIRYGRIIKGKKLILKGNTLKGTGENLLTPIGGKDEEGGEWR